MTANPRCWTCKYNLFSLDDHPCYLCKWANRWRQDKYEKGDAIDTREDPP